MREASTEKAMLHKTILKKASVKKAKEKNAVRKKIVKRTKEGNSVIRKPVDGESQEKERHCQESRQTEVMRRGKVKI
jgi:hypothetical protein